MKLRNAHVTNFRCIDDSEKFNLDQVTCLVGKNESGKTTLLQALYRLNPVSPEHAAFNRDADYPRRHLSDYAERHPENTVADVVTTQWDLEDGDRAALKDLLGPAVDGIQTINIQKGYEPHGNLRVSFDAVIDEAAVVRYLLAQSDLVGDQKSDVAGQTTIEGLRTTVETIAPQTQQHTSLLATIARLAAPEPLPRAESVQSGAAAKIATKFVVERLPKFIYFSQYQRMAGRIPLGSLRGRIEGNQPLGEEEKTFLSFCALANATFAELANIANFENLVARFEGASNKITNQIFKYWTQNKKLRVQFTRNTALPQDPPPYNTGEIFNVRIWNDLHQVSVPFDERSAGFVWFFSFLVYFSQIKKSHGQRLIILLDEPGLTLHARAQGDLLRYIDEQLAPHHQVVYTTHSPFMVPTNLMNARTVEDVWREKDGDIRVDGVTIENNIFRRRA